MRIINYNKFVRMPNNTIYAEYIPCYFENVKIKQDNIIHDDRTVHDWYYQEFVCNPDWECSEHSDFSTVCEILEKESVLPDFDTMTRDGMFDYERKFLIYEKADIELMIDKLKTLL